MMACSVARSDGTMRCLLSILLTLTACLDLVVAATELVPGKAFDRFITIWLENQVAPMFLFLVLQPSQSLGSGIRALTSLRVFFLSL